MNRFLSPPRKYTWVLAGVFLPLSLTLRPVPSLEAAQRTIAWEHIEPYPTSQHLRSIAYGNGVWVVAGHNVLLRTRDMLQWTTLHTPQAFPQLGQSVWGVYFTGSEFVVTGLNSNCILLSPDGVNWRSICFEGLFGNAFAAAGNGVLLVGQRDIHTTSDHRTFYRVPGTMPADVFELVFANGKFVTVTDNGTFMSEDGVSWTQPWPGQKPRGGLYSLNNAFYRTYQGAVYQSTDGAQWAVLPVPGKPDITGMCFGKGYYYVVANGRIQRTAAFSQWAEVPAFTTIGLNAIAYGDDRFLAVGQHGVMFWSRDGVEWQNISRGSRMDLHGVTYHNGAYVAVGAEGTVLTSTDARRWEPQDPGTRDTLRSVTSADGVFVAVGDSGRLITSSSGVEWSSRFVPVFGGLLNVQFLNGSFYAVGTGGALLRSRDAHSWESLPTGLTNDLQSICYQDGVYLVAARDRAVPIEGYCRLYQTTNFVSWVASPLAVSLCPQLAASPTTVFNGNGYGPSLRQAGYTRLTFEPPLGGWAPNANVAQLEGDIFVAFATTSSPIGAAYGWSIPDGGARVAPFQYVSPRPMRDVARGPQGFVAVGDGGEIRLGTLPRDGDAELPAPPARMEQTSATRWRLVTSGSSTFAVSVDASTSLTEWESVAGSGGWYADEVGGSVELTRDLGFFRIVQMPIEPVPEAVPEPDERIGLLSVRPQPREWSVVRVDGETAVTATTQPSPRARLVSSNGVLYLQLGDLRLMPFCPSTTGFRMCDAPVESVRSTLVQSVIVGDAQTGGHVIVWRPERVTSLLECRTAVWSNRQYAQRDPDTGISELKRALAFTGLYLHDLEGTPQVFDTAVTVNMNPAGGNVMDCEISGGIQFAGRIQDCGVDLISPVAVPSAELLQFSLRVGSGNAACAFTMRRQGKLDCFIGMAVP